MEQKREQRTAHVSVARGLVCSVQECSCGYDTSCIGELGLWKSEGGCIKVLATWKGTGEARAERLSKKATFETKVDSAVVAWWIGGNCHAKTSQLYMVPDDTHLLCLQLHKLGSDITSLPPSGLPKTPSGSPMDLGA